MKNILIILFLAIAFTSKAQVVTGLYTGTIYNDTTKMLQQYEVALSEYKGKISGYSYTTYVVNDTFYYGIRQVKASKKDGNLVIEDEKFIVNNFPESPAKGVRRVSVMPLQQVDTIANLNGKWQTNRTKIYYSVSGSVNAKRDNDSSQSALINHLKELGLIGANNDVAQVKIKSKENKQKIKIEPAKESPKPSEPAKPVVASVLPYTERSNKKMQSFEVQSDSLTLSFYDNGVVDGDVISVYLDGNNVISNVKLTELAVKKTIAVPKNSATGVELKLVAENLGSLPPNTGLLVIQDGSNKYNVHFSADLSTNATIVIRKKN